MKIPLPEGKYLKKLEIGDDGIDIEFTPRLKIALCLISLNERYWEYAKQVIKDCKVNFLPQHKVDYFVWSDMPENEIPGVTVVPTEPIEWPHPTLLRYHLFLGKEEELEKYDYIFYLDADMRVIAKISDEILGNDLTIAQHPMYALKKQYIPPYEPNTNSAAFIPRLGQIVDDATEKAGTPEDILKAGGKPRYKPLYIAGGFQGGKSKVFLKAMKVIKKGIDKDFNNNYTAIWNDESHWNQYLYQHRGPILSPEIIVLGPDYIYPDSLIKEYYEPLWGKVYVPKIITITKPFSLSKQAGSELNKMLGRPDDSFTCPDCKNVFTYPGHKIIGCGHCTGSGKPHPLEMRPL